MDDVCFQFPGQTKSVVVKVITYFHLHEPREKADIQKENCPRTFEHQGYVQNSSKYSNIHIENVVFVFSLNYSGSTEMNVTNVSLKELK